MPLVFVDTPAFYALLERDDLHHKAAGRQWNQLLDSGAALVTSNYVVVETCALLQRRLGLAAVRVFMEELLPTVTVEWVSPQLHASAYQALLAANRKGLSLVDCASFAMMRAQAAHHALAFDRHFRGTGIRAAVLVSGPQSSWHKFLTNAKPLCDRRGSEQKTSGTGH